MYVPGTFEVSGTCYASIFLKNYKSPDVCLDEIPHVRSHGICQ